MNKPLDAYTVAIFGEAEKGEYQTAYFCQSLSHLDEFLGNPPKDSRGLYYAVQALLFQRELIFFRVLEEGYSAPDYFHGIEFLEKQRLIPHIDAICAPGVGDKAILDAIVPICMRYRSILITNESDFYDYLTYEKEL
jgi:hypothetical protein